jgi:glycerol kinase
VVADQQAAAFGHFLTSPGQVKLTLGTGAFVTVNSGSKLIFNNAENIYTLIGWKLEDRPPVYLTETCVEDYAEVLSASARLGVNLHSSVDYQPKEIDQLLFSHLKEEGLPIQNGAAIDVLIEIAFLIVARIAVMAEHIQLKYPLRTDGGLSNSKILLRILATLLREPVARPTNCESTSFGTALLAGIGARLWSVSDVEDLSRGDFEIHYPGPSSLRMLLVKHRKCSRNCFDNLVS